MNHDMSWSTIKNVFFTTGDNMKTIRKGNAGSTMLAVAIGCAFAATPFSNAYAQDSELEEIVVTGSYISRPADRPQPVAIMEAAEIRANQRVSTIEVLRDMPQISSANVAEKAHDALATGAPILADCRMVASGISRSRLAAGNEVICTLGAAGLARRAATAQTTRSAAAVDLWRPQLAGALCVIGNAPTALFRLLELLAGAAPRPAAIVATPPGFVGASESKAALAGGDHGVPFLTLLGRRGGSAVAAAAVNALAAPPDAEATL